MSVCQATLIVDAKQATSEGKSGLVETDWQLQPCSAMCFPASETRSAHSEFSIHKQ